MNHDPSKGSIGFSPARLPQGTGAPMATGEGWNATMSVTKNVTKSSCSGKGQDRLELVRQGQGCDTRARREKQVGEASLRHECHT